MNLKIKFLLFSLCLVAAFSGASAGDTVKKAFANAPFEVVPTISPNVRLDMIDYFEHGMARPSSSYFGDDIMLLALDSLSLTFQTSAHCTTSIYVVSEPKDTLYFVVDTYRLPVTDSNVKVYDTSWNLKATLQPGYIEDWINNDGKKEKKFADIENAVSFITAKAVVDPATATVTYSNTTADRVSPDEYAPVEKYIKPERRFSFNGKSFKEITR